MPAEEPLLIDDDPQNYDDN